MSISVSDQLKDIKKYFKKTYDTFQGVKPDDDGVITFKSNDASYRIDDVSVKAHEMKGTTTLSDFEVKLKLTHIRGGELSGDDVATLTLTFDTLGELTDVTGDIKMGSDFLRGLVITIAVAAVVLVGTVVLTAATAGAAAIVATGFAGATVAEIGAEVTVDTIALAETAATIAEIAEDDADLGAVLDQVARGIFADNFDFFEAPLGEGRAPSGEIWHKYGEWFQGLDYRKLTSEQAEQLADAIKTDFKNSGAVRGQFGDRLAQVTAEVRGTLGPKNARSAMFVSIPSPSAAKTAASASSQQPQFNAPDYVTAGALTAVANVLTQWASQIESAGDDASSGRINFSSVIVQAILRAQYAMLASFQDMYANGPLVKFDVKSCEKHAENTSHVSELTSAKDDKALEYKYKDEKYRFWFPDLTNSYGGKLITFSNKLDLDNGGKDDHVLLLLTYVKDTKKLAMAHATIAIQGSSNMNVGPIVYDDDHHPIEVDISSKGETLKLAPGGDTIEITFQALIQSTLKKNKKWDDWSKQVHNIDEVVAAAVMWLASGL